MSQTKTIIDTRSSQLLTFKRKVRTKDADGHLAEGTPLTLASEVIGDIQPLDGKMSESTSGSSENEGEKTHVCFVQDRVTVALKTGKDYIEDENGVKYLIVFIHDFRGVPQEFDLMRETDGG